MPWSTVSEILMVGLSGLVFLLAFLGYRLLAMEHRKPAPDAGALRSARLFMWQSLALAIVVGGFAVGDRLVAAQSGARQGGVRECRDSLSRLETQLKVPGASKEDLLTLAGAHVSTCSGPLSSLDR